MAFPSVAATLQEASSFALENVYGVFANGNDLSTRLTQWKDGAFAVLDADRPDQRNLGFWVVPTLFLIGDLPSLADQNNFHAYEVVDLLTRTLQAMIDTADLTAAQQAAIVNVYNASWTVP